MSGRVVLGGLLAVSLSAWGETLRYAVSWASGLNLGEATLESVQSGTAGPWTFSLELDVSVPGFALRDRYSSWAGADLCSQKLEKKTARGQRKAEERVTFDQEKHTIARETVGGGKSESSGPPCAREALAFLQFVRQELAEGRLAPRQTVVFGARYQVRFDYLGVQHVPAGKQRVEAERIQTSIQGPASEVTAEIFFSRDAARTPLLARIPLPLGTFVVELLR
jgi:hypothetical protein